MTEQQPTPEERDNALRTNLEVMSGMLHDILPRIDKLAEVSAEHERENNRFRRIMNAALIEYLRDDENGGER